MALPPHPVALSLTSQPPAPSAPLGGITGHTGLGLTHRCVTYSDTALRGGLPQFCDPVTYLAFLARALGL